MIKTKIIFYFAVIFLLMVISDICAANDCITSKFLFDIKSSANQPSDIAMGSNGDIYLVDGVNNRIIVFNSSGKRKFEFGREGAGKGEFKYPLGIDISDDGKVFIADTGNHRIQIFNLKGDFRNMFNVKSGPEERPSDPVDVLASRLKNNLYISDNDNHKIRVYDQNGTFVFEWGKFGEEPGEFRYPGILAQNENNEIIVVDVLNTRVQKFDPFGNFIDQIGSWGVLPGSMFRPKGVAVDKENRVFVTDSYMGVVQVFTDLGRFIGVICENNNHRKFVTPVGIAVDDKAKRLFVVEMRANKINVLKLQP